MIRGVNPLSETRASETKTIPKDTVAFQLYLCITPYPLIRPCEAAKSGVEVHFTNLLPL
jgi:hypothetical protein